MSLPRQNCDTVPLSKKKWVENEGNFFYKDSICQWEIKHVWRVSGEKNLCAPEGRGRGGRGLFSLLRLKITKTCFGKRKQISNKETVCELSWRLGRLLSNFWPTSPSWSSSVPTRDTAWYSVCNIGSHYTLIPYREELSETFYLWFRKIPPPPTEEGKWFGWKM
jgi:hypothetical protein